MKVSIITVCYNSAKTIARTIESVLSQTYPEIEYIIVDGLSSDATVSVAQKYLDAFKNKGYSYTIVSEKDGGMYDALNKGSRLCTGSIVGQINADDWYEDTAVQNMVELFTRENCDVAWADINVYTRNGSFVKKAKIGKKLWVTSGFCHPSMFSKRTVLLEYPYACEKITDDFDYATRVYLDKTKKISTLNTVVANYVLGGMGSRKNWKETKIRIKNKYYTYKKHGMSKLYWFYCVFVEVAKYIVG